MVTAGRSLSFAEVLEEEYRYFFDRVDYETIQFDRRHIRELGALAQRLELIVSRRHDRSNAPNMWRWLVLANARASSDQVSVGPEERVLLAFQTMLADEELLHRLLDTEEGIAEIIRDIAEPLFWRALLRVPEARIRLLREPKLASAIAADPGLIPSFAGTSSAIRLLLKDGFRPAFELYPALLSSIADEPTLTKALIEDGDLPGSARERRRLLVERFVPQERQGFFVRMQMRMRKLFLRPEPTVARQSELADIAASSAATAQVVGVTLPPLDKEAPAYKEQSARFNAVVIESIYREYVSDGHYMRSLYGFAQNQELAALCLSGGGIRSATFNLGVLQGLADHRILNRFHYISTVSGGGYIGGWLSSWIRRHREGAVGVAKDLSREPADPLSPEVKPIQHLRAYTSYLAPRSSPFSVDTWTVITTYLRNLLLNWAMLIPALAAALALPRLLEAAVRSELNGLFVSVEIVRGLTILSVAVAIVSLACIRPRSAMTATQAHVEKGDFLKAQRKVYWWFAPLVIGGFFFNVYWASGEPQTQRWWLIAALSSAAVAGALIYAWRRSREGLAPGGVLQRLCATVVAMFRNNWRQTFAETVGASLAGGLTGWLLLTLFGWLFPPNALQELDALWLETYVVCALPLFLIVFFVGLSFVVGATTASASEHDREWWARSAAVLLLCAAVHFAGTFAVVLLPLLMGELPACVGATGGVSGLASWLISSRHGKTGSDTEQRGGKWLMSMLNVAAAITLLFIIALIALGTTYVLRTADTSATAIAETLEPVTRLHLASLRDASLARVAAFMLIALLISLVVSLRLNVNIYSMHGMYRNRLVRAYLGASRWNRHPDAFTGFDPQDDTMMWELRPEVLWPASFIDFDIFARQLVAEPRVFGEISVDLQSRLRAYARGERGDDDRERVKTATIDELNLLMLRRDIEHEVNCPSSLDLLRANRTWLEKTFSAIREVDEHVELRGRDMITVKSPPNASLAGPASSPQPIRGRPPLHILNATLNLVGGEKLAWQERKAASFTISPLHCGSRNSVYRDALIYGDESEPGNGISLGTAVAISGAAVSPNMGSISSPIVTFLMTLFNARLGWWVGNPKHPTAYRKNSPTNSLWTLIREALGKTDDSRPYVYLSDGGFFENLGLYEMVARRCKYIIVCDASSDGQYGFADLGNAVRKIRIDLGVPIELETKYVAPSAGEKHGKYCAVGKILYADVDGAVEENYAQRCGKLLYVKPAVFETCPPDVRNYRTEHRSFPHDSTADQFFNESQFESYRALGRHTIGKICDPIDTSDASKIGKATWQSDSIAEFFSRAEGYVRSSKTSTGDMPVAKISNIVQWMNDSL
ncbi:MAG: patatin-like phospholipase family protein [Thermoanaerobaculia bacterium]